MRNELQVLVFQGFHVKDKPLMERGVHCQKFMFLELKQSVNVHAAYQEEMNFGLLKMTESSRIRMCDSWV